MERFALLYTELADYTRACLQTLKGKYAPEILAIHYPPAANAPFHGDMLAGIAKTQNRYSFDNAQQLADCVCDFDPEVVYVSGWSDKIYLQAARILKKRGYLVISGMDTIYRDEFRQWVATKIAPYYLHSAFDIIWAAGERQRAYAAKLGYDGDHCWTGLYSCDWDRFHALRGHSSRGREAFLFVGRYVAAKGLDLLVAAYEQYRRKTESPWDLICVGRGPAEYLLEGVPGVENRGFIQPSELPVVLAECSAFVLPSRDEPWGVVIQEAATVGLPIICSDCVGASAHLVQDFYNGYTFKSGEVDALEYALLRMSTLSDEKRRLFGERSVALSKQFTPERWADTLVEGSKRFKSQ